MREQAGGTAVLLRLLGIPKLQRRVDCSVLTGSLAAGVARAWHGGLIGSRTKIPHLLGVFSDVASTNRRTCGSAAYHWHDVGRA
jgi:hypothetical protein